MHALYVLEHVATSSAHCPQQQGMFAVFADQTLLCLAGQLKMQLGPDVLGDTDAGSMMIH